MSLLVVLVLTALPVSATLCAILCDLDPPATAAHHGPGKTCDGPARSADDVRMGGIAVHECGNHGVAIRHLATTAAARGGLAATSVPADAPAAYAAFAPLPDFKSIFRYTSPPGPAPPTTPLVLRV
jgi:hypothetical protein